MPTPTGKQRRHAVSVFPTSILGASLALGLALSVALTGCGEDSTTTPAPAPAPAPSPAPAPDPVGTPGDLKVTAAGADFLEFSWEAVEGATGYEIQLSLKADDFTSVSTAMVTTTMHRFTDLAAETTGYARVRAHEGDRQSDWSETAMGMSDAAPLVLGMPVPTVSSRGPDYIEWMWEAVEGALQYQVQVADSMDGFMDSADPAAIVAQLQAGTTYRAAEVDPETTMYLRVRAAAGTPTAPLFGEWSAPVMGMSEVAPMPFTVSMWPPERGADSDCSGQAFCPDDGTDPAKAMASPNPRMLVTSSHPAKITPMFGDGLPAVTVQAEENATPFRLVAGWNALQRAVVTEGAVFRFDRISVGAGQEATAMGDAMYITCGPFRCSEAAAERPEAPVVSADAVCEEFETNFRLVKGMRRNKENFERFNGVDVGWLYTLSHPATVTHEFGNVQTRNGPLTVPGGALRVTDTETPLSMVASTSATSQVNKFGGPANRDNDRDTGTDPGPIRNGYTDGQPDDCEDLTDLGSYDMSYLRATMSLGENRRDAGKVERPPGCFRLMTDAIYDPLPFHAKGPVTWHDYVPDYRLHVDPQSAISWAGSSVAWGDDDPFADLKCERVTFEVAEQLDVCADFQAEAEAFWGKGIDGGQFQPEFRITGATNVDGKVTHINIRNKAPAPSKTGDAGGREYRPDGSRHAHMWLVSKLDGVPTTNMAPDGTLPDYDLYTIQGNNDATSAVSGDWRPIMSRMAVDGDGDPIGDFGKIDMVDASGNTPRPGSDGNPENWDDNPDADSCTDDDGGKGCDAVWSFDLSATLTRIADTETCTYPIELSLTCTWDADGDERRGGDTVFDTRTTNINRFITCEPS